MESIDFSVLCIANENDEKITYKKGKTTKVKIF